MAIDKYSGLSQSDKFYARYGKAIGKETVKRQQTHLALESIKNKATAQLQLPNYAAQAPKQQLRLPNLAGGIYEQATQAATKPKVSDAFVRKMLKKIANDPTFNLRAADLTPEQIAAVEARLAQQSAQATEIAITSSKPILPGAQKPNFTISGATGAAGNSTVAGATGSSGGMLAPIKKVAQGTTTGGTPNLPMIVNGEKTAEGTKGAKGLLERLKALAKSPKGKIGAAIAIAATVIGTGVYLLKRNKDIEGPTSDSSPANDLANVPVNGNMTANGPYTVAKGDNVWTIARANLMELHKGEADYKPTDVEILQRTEEIMQLNDLHYEKDNYRVIIQPNQSLKLTA